MKRAIEKSLSPSEKDFNVLNFRSNSKGEIIVVLPSKDDEEKAAARLSEKGISLGFTTNKAKDRHPRMIINDIPSDISDLTTELLLSNPEISNLTASNPQEYIPFITFLSKRDPHLKNAVIETTSKMNKILKNTANVK